LHEAKREIEAGKMFDYQITNDNLDEALKNLQRIFDKKEN
jgi:guanylate kinase